MFWHLTFLLACYLIAKHSKGTTSATGPAQWYRNLPCCSSHTKDHHIPSQGAPKRTSCSQTQQIITPYQTNIKNHSLLESGLIENYNETIWGTRWRSWLRHCATSRKVEGSIPDGFTGIFHWHNPSGRTMALGMTQPLIEISTWDIFWEVKAAGA